MNKYYNMKVSELQKTRSRKSQYPLNKVKNLARKRMNKINDYLHKASKKIIDIAVKNKTKQIVIWKNVNWKHECKLKNFVQIPHARLISLIEYKAFLNWIEVVLTEESYTSITDHLWTKEKWERVYRWLFRSLIWMINADVNWAIWILRKVSGDGFLRSLASKGLMYNPVRINLD